MLQVEFVRQMIGKNKCLKTSKFLDEADFLISRTAFPKLYSGSADRSEADFIKYIHDVLPALFVRADRELRSALRAFMQVVLKNGRMHNEEFLHRFLFEFWTDLCDSSVPFVLDEKYFKGQRIGDETEFSRNVVQRVYQHGEHIPDILGFSGGDEKCVYIVEIKNEKLDDRALGQILRYYQVVRRICDRLAKQWYVRRVVPLLVVPDGHRSFWQSMPFYFREVVEIVYWKAGAEGTVELHDGKRRLREMVSGIID
jgi:hypothetical protein